LIATNSIPLIKISISFQLKQATGENSILNTCPLLSLTDILVHYLLLAQEKLSTFKTVKDYENGSNE
jgi:hypothetical protein